MVATLALLAVLMTVAFGATAPDIPVLELTLALLAVAVVAPIVLFPWSMTIWLAIDLTVHRPSDPELRAAADYVSSVRMLASEQSFDLQ
jgi:NhaP-type Na+/H+ or K+/H+ antiporter